MPKKVILPPGTHTPIAPFSPGTLADNIVYVSGTLAFDKDNIPEEKAERLGEYCMQEAFTPAVVAKASKACTAVCMWARAMCV